MNLREYSSVTVDMHEPLTCEHPSYDQGVKLRIDTTSAISKQGMS